MNTPFTRLAIRTLLAAALGGLSCAGSTHELTLDECREGSEFIKHAAMSRDYGITREDFLGRMRADIVAIQQFPPQLRWFVQDEEDAALLTGAAERVFDVPRTPELHETEFLQACTAHTAWSSDRSSVRTDSAGDTLAVPTAAAGNK